MHKGGTKESPVLRWGREKVVEVFRADLRSLAAFRMVLAVLVLADLANRATDLYAHYTDAGILPRSVLMEGELNPWSFSLNMMNGELYFQMLVFGLGVLAALGLLFGYQTRLVSVIVWVVMLSIQYRNPLVGSAADTLLRMLLFWGMFLPLGAYWSVDRLLDVPPKATPQRLSMHFLSLATVGLFLQIAFLYWFAGLHKSGLEWRADGTALYYALSLDQIATPLGTYLLNFPTLLTVLTFATIALEFAGPFLLFYPFLFGPVRTGVVLAFMSLHFGIWLTMSIGIFPWVSALCMVCFLPGWFWEKIAKLRPALLPHKPDIMRRLQHTMARLLPVHVYERLLFWVRSSATSTSEPTVLRSSLAINLLAAVFLLYIFFWNLTTVSSFTMPERIVPLGYILGLEQDWSMFSPSPPKNDGWYVIPGTLNNGKQVDLMGFTRDEPSLRVGVSWEKPQHINDTFKNEHWRKYLDNIQEGDRDDLSEYFGDYICREWNARHTDAESLKSFQIAFMMENTLPDYQTPTVEKWALPEQSCS